MRPAPLDLWVEAEPHYQCAICSITAGTSISPTKHWESHGLTFLFDRLEWVQKARRLLP